MLVADGASLSAPSEELSCGSKVGAPDGGVTVAGKGVALSTGGGVGDAAAVGVAGGAAGVGVPVGALTPSSCGAPPVMLLLDAIKTFAPKIIPSTMISVARAGRCFMMVLLTVHGKRVGRVVRA